MSQTTPSDLTARARLRMAALRLFADKGFAATSTRAIATEAGVSHALLRHHYGSKDGLRRAVDEEVLHTFDRVLADLDTAAAPGGALAALGTVTARLFGEDEVHRHYLRRSLLEGSEASTELFARLLEGARRHLALLGVGHDVGDDTAGSDLLWAPYQALFLILGPMLLEPVMRSTLHGPVFAPEILSDRSASNQRLLARGLGIDSDARDPS
ncbi:TetR/AcrR family transcriptional regulator [Nocardiopsis sp. NPDC101807]|uniref:TetR/AcrR family transcriptional regulator n=1 Tax=Nocardiopsis sp. NPDC101807 TaxID=3364339 RepID=UPI0038284F11